MSGKIPVFDNLGNNIGDFTPAGGGPIEAAGCLFLGLFAGTAVGLFNLFVWLVEGAAALFSGDWDEVKPRAMFVAILGVALVAVTFCIGLVLLSKTYPWILVVLIFISILVVLAAPLTLAGFVAFHNRREIKKDSQKVVPIVLGLFFSYVLLAPTTGILIGLMLKALSGE